MSPAKTNAERQRDFRARRAAEDVAEVRGIMAPLNRHADIKEAAAKVLRKRAAAPLVKKVALK